jgi:hypothetical protein
MLNMNARTRSSLLFFMAAIAISAIACSRDAFARQTNDAPHIDSPKHRLFEFDGGDPLDFIRALDLHFRTRLIQILTLPETLRGASVPKIRIEANDPKEVLTVYNRLDNPELGKWHYEPESPSSSTNLGVLTLVPDKAVVTADLQKNSVLVRAFPIADISTNKWDNLVQSIGETKEMARSEGISGMVGRVYIQRDLKVLIASGSDAYIQFIYSMVSACRDNSRMEASTPPAK